MRFTNGVVSRRGLDMRRDEEERVPTEERQVSRGSWRATSRRAFISAASLLLIGAIGMMLFLAGCSDDGEAAAGAALAASSGAIASPNTITVVGKATVQSAPDEATVTLTVENDGTEPGAVLNSNSKSIQQVLDRLKAEGIEDSAVQTSNVSVYPIRTYDPKSGKESLTGYRAQNSVTVTLKDAALVGKVLAASVETGATNVSGPVWRLTEDSAAVSDALTKAVANAQAKAQALATAQGVALGPVVMMSEGVVDLPVIPMYADFSAAESTEADRVAEAPISPGTLDVAATVTVSYGLVR